MGSPASSSSFFNSSTPPKTTQRPVRVMVIDDSLTVRTVYARMISSDDRLEMVASFPKAEHAFEALEKTPVDVIVLDLEMPGMGGLKALPKLLSIAQNARILVVSSYTKVGAQQTVAALSMGAADTLEKPQSGQYNQDYSDSFLKRILVLGQGLECKSDHARGALSGSHHPRLNTKLPRPPSVIAFGASTGGIHALNIILRALPERFDIPILITQHLPDKFVSVFSRMIETTSARQTRIAQTGMEIRPGEVIVASAQGHIEVHGSPEKPVIQISKERMPNGCQPSVDPMLSSLGRIYRERALGVLLSGMGRDGLRGASDLVEAGGAIIAQDAQSCAVWGMPGAVAQTGIASAVLPPDAIAKALLRASEAASWN